MLFLALSAPMLARAAPGGRNAVLVPRFRSDLSPEVRARFHDALTRGLEGSGEVLSASEVRVRLAAPEDLLSCDGAQACAARASATLRADRLVAADIEVSGKQYTFHLRLLDPWGNETARLDDTCDICSLKEADDAAARAVGRLLTQPRSAAPATPAPAPAPAPPPAPAPMAPSRLPIDSPDPVATPPASTAPAAAVSDAPRKLRPYRPVAITLLAAGLVAVAVAAPLMGIDGNPTCDLPDARRACPEIYSTMAGGATALGVGIGSILSSGVLFYLDRRQSR